jgi:hypothetical protein
MRQVRNRCGAVSTLILLILSGCAAAPKGPPAPPPAAAAPILDASYDWHGLLLLPFGSVIKDAPFTLHEVLMFRDTAHAAQGDDAECYARDLPAPRFLKRTPSKYLLCFKQDHLARIEAAVSLPPEEAAQIFSDACGLWQRNAGAAQAGATQAGAVQTTPVDTDACEGRDGAVGYSGRLEEDGDGTGTVLTIHLDTQASP